MTKFKVGDVIVPLGLKNRYEVIKVGPMEKLRDGYELKCPDWSILVLSAEYVENTFMVCPKWLKNKQFRDGLEAILND